MKKLMAMGMIAVLALTGCGSKGSSDSSEGEAVIKIGVEETYVPYFEEVTKAYTEANPNVKFQISQTKTYDLLDALPAQKGNSADIFVVPNDRIGDLADKKLIADVSADLSGYTETAQNAAKYKDKTWFVPFSTDTTLLFYNKSLTTTIPATLKELDTKEFAAKFTDFYVTYGMFSSNGGYIFGDSTSDVGLNNEGAYKAGEAIKALYASKANVWEALKEEEAGYNLMVDSFCKGEIKYMIDGPWKYSDFVKNGMSEDQIGFTTIPSWDGSGEYKPLASTKGLTVNAYSKHKEEALKFLNTLATKENAELWYTSTKEISPHTGVTYEEGSLAKVVLDATANAIAMPTDPALSKVWEPMADALKQIANGGEVKASLDSAVDTIKIEIDAMAK